MKADGVEIAVIGGGIGGMESAIVCAKRGHKVTLYEKSDKLGGVFIAAAAPSFKEKDRDLIAWYRRELAKYPIDVELNTEVADITSLEADEIIIATGNETVTIKHEAEDRSLFAGGALTAAAFLQGKAPGYYTMQDILAK